MSNRAWDHSHAAAANNFVNVIGAECPNTSGSSDGSKMLNDKVGRRAFLAQRQGIVQVIGSKQGGNLLAGAFTSGKSLKFCGTELTLVEMVTTPIHRQH